MASWAAALAEEVDTRRTSCPGPQPDPAGCAVTAPGRVRSAVVARPRLVAAPRLIAVGSMMVSVLIAVVLAGGQPAFADWIRDQQWQLSALHAQAAWRYSTGAGVVVAVLDSGVDATAPDLAGQVLPGADFVDGSTDGRVDYVGHGSTVAAFIAGHDDAEGVAGLAPDARILPVRVLDRQNRYGDADSVAAGLRWAVDHGARVVNLSLGGARSSAALTAAVAYAIGKDVVVVACTGNVEPGGTAHIWYPARQAGVVAVSGLTQDSGQGVRFWPGALTGPETVLAAPAAWLVGVKPGGYWRVAGTSFAAPLVAASAALVRARWPHLPAAEVINRLIRTATDLGPRGRDGTYGFGEVNPLAAVTAAVAAVAANPLLAATGPPLAPAAGLAGGPPGGSTPRPSAVPAPSAGALLPRSAGDRAAPPSLAPTAVAGPWRPAFDGSDRVRTVDSRLALLAVVLVLGTALAWRRTTIRHRR